MSTKNTKATKSKRKINQEMYQEAAKNPLVANAESTPAARRSTKTQKRKPGAGRPHVSEELLMQVIERMCEGESLNQICKDTSMPSKGTVLNYAMMIRDPEEKWVQNFAKAYQLAKQIRAESWADEMIEIAKQTVPVSEEIQKSKLEIETMKWLTSKLLNQYSDKSRHEITGADGGPVKSENSVVFYLPDNGRKDKSLEHDDES